MPKEFKTRLEAVFGRVFAHNWETWLQLLHSNQGTREKQFEWMKTENARIVYLEEFSMFERMENFR